jgi:hypothetical protein
MNDRMKPALNEARTHRDDRDSRLDEPVEQHAVDAGGAGGPPRSWYSYEELTAIIRALNDPNVVLDPRFELLMHVGAGFRPGVLIRAMRSELYLEGGVLRIRRSGKGRGFARTFTGALRERVGEVLATGYLSDLEDAYQRGDIDDYPIFPAGKLCGGKSQSDGGRGLDSVGSFWLRRHFQKLETAADVEHLPRRGWLGLRRAVARVLYARGVSVPATCAVLGVRNPGPVVSLCDPRTTGQAALEALLQELAAG